MYQHDNRGSQAPPAGFRWHETARFGFAIAVPRRFHLIANTIDPVADAGVAPVKNRARAKPSPMQSGRGHRGSGIRRSSADR